MVRSSKLRLKFNPQGENAFRAGKWAYDLRTNKVFHNEIYVDVKPHFAALLGILIRKHPAPVSRQEALEEYGKLTIPGILQSHEANSLLRNKRALELAADIFKTPKTTIGSRTPRKGDQRIKSVHTCKDGSIALVLPLDELSQEERAAENLIQAGSITVAKRTLSNGETRCMVYINGYADDAYNRTTSAEFIRYLMERQNQYVPYEDIARIVKEQTGGKINPDKLPSRFNELLFKETEMSIHNDGGYGFSICTQDVWDEMPKRSHRHQATGQSAPAPART